MGGSASSGLLQRFEGGLGFFRGMIGDIDRLCLSHNYVPLKCILDLKCCAHVGLVMLIVFNNNEKPFSAMPFVM